MTTAVVASAPGKVVLSGEYAVLDGAPAICVAVNRRARAILVELSGDVSEVAAPGFANEVGRFEVHDGSIQWQDGYATYAVVDSVWQAAGMAQTPALSMQLDTAEFIDPRTQQKIGIGSSAAITVALCAAIEASAEVVSLTSIAQEAHANLQNGAGSGIDIACSLSGGLIEYRMDGARTTPLEWPEGLFYRLIWSQVTASTRDKLAQLHATKSKPSRERLVSASIAMAGAWRSSNAEQVIAAYEEYCEHLWQFSADHGLGIFDAGHDALWRAATAAGLTYKPCGAGGGDVGILLATNDADLDAFTDARSRNYSVLDCEISQTGVRIE